MATYQLTAGGIVSLSCIVCTKPFTYTTKSKGRHARFCGDDCRATRCAQQMRATPRKGRTQRKSCARGGGTSNLKTAGERQPRGVSRRDFTGWGIWPARFLVKN